MADESFEEIHTRKNIQEHTTLLGPGMDGKAGKHAVVIAGWRGLLGRRRHTTSRDVVQATVLIGRSVCVGHSQPVMANSKRGVVRRLSERVLVRIKSGRVSFSRWHVLFCLPCFFSK